MNEEPIKVINLFTRQQVVAKNTGTDLVPVVTVIDDQSLKLAEHVIKMIKAGDLIGLAIVGVNPKTDVPVVATTDSLPRLYQETLRLFALDLIKEGMIDNIHDRIEFKDSDTPDDEPISPEPEEPVVE